MSLTTSEMTPADIRACTCGNDGYNNGGMWGGDWLAYLLLFALIGNGGFGFGGGFGGGGILPWLLFGNGGFSGAGATNGYVLTSDFANIERKLDGINNGICDSTFALNNSINGNFRTLDGAICNLGYQALQNTNAIQTQISGVQSQIAGCCCDIQGAIKDVAYGNAMNTNQLDRRISDCCCDIEKMNMQNRFDAQAYNCNTLQAIDKLGDRIESRMTAMETARTRELLDAERTKNAILQGQIDRAQLRYDIVNDVRPCPQPAYITCNPYAASYGCNPCGCGSGSF